MPSTIFTSFWAEAISWSLVDYLYMFFWIWLLQTSIPICLFVLGLLINTLLRRLVPAKHEIPLLAGDASWFHDNPKNRIIIHSPLFLDGLLNEDKLRDMFMRRIIDKADSQNMFFKFTHLEIARLGVMMWTPDPHFDIKNHIYSHDAIIESKQEEQLLFSIYLQKPLPANQPPWQIILIHSQTNTTLLFRFKHTIADGISLLRLLMEHLVDEQTSLSIGTQPHRDFKSMTLLDYVKKGVKIITDMPPLVKTLYKAADKHCLKATDLSGEKIVAWSSKIDLGTFKQIKNREGATVNDVIVAAICEAISRYLKERSQTVERDITVYIPITNVWTGGQLVLENNLGVIPAQLSISDKHNFLERIQLVKAESNKMKNSTIPYVCGLTQSLLCLSLPPFILGRVLETITDRGTAVFSNVPGPSKQLKIGGVSVDNIMFFVPTRSSLGIGVSFISYCGEVQISIATDTSIVPNPNEIIQIFEQIIEENKTDRGVISKSG